MHAATAWSAAGDRALWARDLATARRCYEEAAARHEEAGRPVEAERERAKAPPETP